MIRYAGINHLALVTSDMERTIRFWRDLLGLRLVATFGRPGYRQYFFQVSDRDLIAFFEWNGAEPVEEKEHGVPVPGPRIFDHVSLGLESREELWKMKDRLEAADIWVSEVIDHGFIHSIYTFDPNGVPLEFSVFIENVDIMHNPVQADENLSKAASEGAELQPGKWPPVTSPRSADQRSVHPGMGADAFKKLDKPKR